MRLLQDLACVFTWPCYGLGVPRGERGKSSRSSCQEAKTWRQAGPHNSIGGPFLVAWWCPPLTPLTCHPSAMEAWSVEAGPGEAASLLLSLPAHPAAGFLAGCIQGLPQVW